MATVPTQFKVPAPLKREFEKALRAHHDHETATEFYQDAMRAFVTQVQRGDRLKYPLEFVTVPKGGIIVPPEVRTLVNEPDPGEPGHPAASSQAPRVNRARAALRALPKR